MVRFTIFLILISVTGSFSEEEDYECFTEKLEMCHSLRPSGEMSETVEELLEFCRNEIKFLNCYADATEECGFPDFSSVARSYIDYLKSDCNEDNPTFQVVISNLPCIKRVTEGPRPCDYNMSEENRERMNNYMEPYLDDELTERSNCVYDTQHFMCDVLRFGYYCGDEVKDAVAEVRSNANTIDCSPEHNEELKPLIPLLEEVILDEIALRDADASK